MSVRKKYCAFLLLVCFFNAGFAQMPAHKELEQKVKQAIHSAYSSSVFLADYDTVQNVRTGSRFSGVVVSEDGIILTAAHVCSPNKTYQVVFPGGEEVIALGLGRLGWADAAVMKIVGKGKWPYSPMGWSSSLHINEPCISIAYPGGFDGKNPVVRLGYVADTTSFRRRPGIRTTCLMEPGDSGGPVFDLYGRVVGIHSRITLPLENNFEIPVDIYRNYWEALLIPENYTTELSAEGMEPDPLKDKRFASAIFPQVDKYFEQMESELDQHCVQIVSNGKDKQDSVIGTLVLPTGFVEKNAMKKMRFVVSKNSLVGENPQLLTLQGKWVPATVLARDSQYDLVLLEVKRSFKKGIDISISFSENFDSSLLGTLLISPQPDAAMGEQSIVGTKSFALPRRMSAGQLGVFVEEKEGKLFVNRVANNTAASDAGLVAGDRIVSINGAVFSKTEEFSLALLEYDPGQRIQFSGIRKDSAFSMEVVLRKRMEGTHAAERFTDGKSLRRDGFPSIFVNDSKLKPGECGGPVFDTEGRFMGINIARYSRTSSLAIPTPVVRNFIQDAVKTRGN